LNYFIVFLIICLFFFNFGNFREFVVDIIPEEDFELKNEPKGTFLEPNEEYFEKQFYPGILGIYSFAWSGIGII